MNSNVPQILEALKISEELLSEQIAGLGVEPNYLIAQDHIMPEVEKSGPAVDVSGLQASISKSFVQTSPSVSTESIKDESSNYILNKPLSEALKEAIDAGQSSPADPAPPPPPSPETSGTNGGQNGPEDVPVYLVTTNEDGTYTVKDPDGTEHVFSSQEEAEAYLVNESKENGYIIVGRSDYCAPDSYYFADVYKDGEKIKSFGNGNSPNGLSQAQGWVEENSDYLFADLSYITETPFLDGINSSSTEDDLTNAIGDELEKTVEGYKDEDFYYTDENGYKVVDNERIQSWYEKVRILCGLLVMLQILKKAKHDARDLVEQELEGWVSDKGLDTATIIGKWVQNRISKVSVSFAKLFEALQEHNQKRYEELVEKAKKKNDSCREKTEDFVTGGSNTIAMLGGMRRATKAYLKATEATLNFINGIDRHKATYGDTNTGDINEYLDNLESSAFGDLSSIVYEGDNDYNELDDEKLVAARNRFNLAKNIRKAWNVVNRSTSEARNLVHEEMTGVGGREKSQNAEKLQELEGQRSEQIFDTRVNLIQQKMGLENQVQYLHEKLVAATWQMFFNIVANIAMVLAIATGIGSLAVGLIFGVFMAAVRLGGSIWAYQITDLYKPDMPDYSSKTRRNNTGSVAHDVINETENMQDEIYEQIDGQMLKKVKDGLYALDYKAIAELQMRLTYLQNVRRSMLTIYQDRASVRKLVHMEMSGIGGRENSEYIEYMNKGDLFQFELSTFMLGEHLTGKNAQISEDKQIQDAIRSFVISIACSMGGAALGAGLGSIASSASSASSAGQAANAGTQAAQSAANASAQAASTAIRTGASIGWSLGGALGSFIASIMNNTLYGSYGAGYGDSSLPAYMQVLKNNNPNSNEAKLQQLELEIYEDMLANGMLDDVGEGYKGLNASHLATLRAKLGRIANIKSAMASLQKAGADARNLVHLEMTSVAGRRAGESVQSINQAEAEGSLRVFNYLTRYLDQRVQVQNRANDARIAVRDSAVKLAVNIVMIAAMSSIGHWGGVSTLFYLMSPALQLFNSIYDLIVALVRSKSGFGELNNYDVAQTVSQINESNSPNSALNRLDELEREAYLEITKDLIEELGAGRWGLSSGTYALFRHKMERVFNIKDAVARVQAAEAEARAAVHSAMGGTGGRASEATSAYTVDRMVAQSLVRDLMRNLQTIVQRHNQMKAAERAACVAAFMVAYAALSFYLSYRSAQNMQAQKKLQKDMKGVQDQMRKLEIERKKLVIDAKAGNKSQDEFDKQVKNIDDAIKNHQHSLTVKQESMTELRKLSRQFALYEYLVNIAESMTQWGVGIIFDSAHGKRQANTDKYNSQVKAVSSENTNKSGWANQTDETENDAIYSGIAAGEAQLDTEAVDIRVQQNEDLLNGSISGIKSSVNYLKGLWEPKRTSGYLGKEIKKNISVPNSPAGQKTAENNGANFKPSDSRLSPNTKVLMDRLDNILSKVEQSVVEMQKVVKKSAEIESKAKVAVEGKMKSSDLKALLKQAEAHLAEARAAYTKAFDGSRAARGDANEYNLKVGEAVRRHEGQIAVLEKDLKELQIKANGRPDAVAAARIKGLKDKVSLAKLNAKALRDKSKILSDKVSSAKKELEESRLKMREAVKQVNVIKAQIERQEKPVSQKETAPHTAAVKHVDNNLKDQRRRNPYDMYRQAQEEQERMATISNKNKVTSAA